jgi:hypothetical protein
MSFPMAVGVNSSVFMAEGWSVDEQHIVPS